MCTCFHRSENQTKINSSFLLKTLTTLTQVNYWALFKHHFLHLKLSIGKISCYFLKFTRTSLARDGPRIQMPASEWGQGIIPLQINQHVLWSLLTTIWELAFQAYFRTYVRNIAAIWTCTQRCATAVCNLSLWLAYVFAEAHLPWIVPMSFEKLQILFLFHIFRERHCNHRCKPSWVLLATSSHLHIWKPLN